MKDVQTAFNFHGIEFKMLVKDRKRFYCKN